MPCSSAKIRPNRYWESSRRVCQIGTVTPAPSVSSGLVDCPDRSLPNVTYCASAAADVSEPPSVKATSFFTVANPNPPSTYGCTFSVVGGRYLTPPATKITGRLAENPTAAGCSRESALNRAGAAGERRVRHVLDLAELGEHLQVGPDR